MKPIVRRRSRKPVRRAKKAHKPLLRKPTAIDSEIRACITEHIRDAKSRKKNLTRAEGRKIFDDAFKSCS
jgi:hypothetical protein